MCAPCLRPAQQCYLVMANSFGFEACSAGSLPLSPSQRELRCLCQNGRVHSESAPAAQTGGKNRESFDCFSVQTVSALHTSLQVANFERCECAFPRPITLVHMCLVYSRMQASSTRGCAFVFTTVQYCIKYRS